MDAEARKHWLALIRAPGIGPARSVQLLEAFHTAEGIFAAGPRGWRSIGLEANRFEGLAKPDWDLVEQDLRWLDAPGRDLITIEDPRYPVLLRETTGAPLALFTQGDTELLPLPQLGIVGARSASPQGLENARAFAAELAKRGLVVTSGLALGIDGAAHQGALDADGLTTAVFGTGLDRVYPARHRDLAHRIAEKGLLISEFSPGVSGQAGHFPRRNRIISGLSLGVLVVEATLESGSLITARFANEQGRDVFAIPGSIHNPMVRGCHKLIRQGAKLVETVDDILEEIAPHIARHAPLRTKAADSDSPDAALLASFGDDPLSFDEIVTRSGLRVDALSTALLRLEMDGQVVAASGGRYQRVRRG
ncbi:MAG: DNA-processing protein DprA [Pseudomonadota bacterium]